VLSLDFFGDNDAGQRGYRPVGFPNASWHTLGPPHLCPLALQAMDLTPIVLDTRRLLWERQKGETSRAYEAFCVYRDLGPSQRSLVNTGRKLGKVSRTMDGWSVKYRWVQRSQAYDDYLDRQRRQSLETAQREAVEVHNQIATALLSKAAKKLLALDPEYMSGADLARYVDIAVRIQRQALEIPDAPVRSEISGPQGGPVMLGRAESEELRERILSRLRQLEETTVVQPGNKRTIDE
jgi:hypothetical protein